MHENNAFIIEKRCNINFDCFLKIIKNFNRDFIYIFVKFFKRLNVHYCRANMFSKNNF